MIATLIENYETLTVVGVFGIVMAWYLWYTTRRQAKREDKREERDEKREDKVLNMVDTSLKNIEFVTMKNKTLNKQIAVIQERTLKAMDEHKAESRDAFSKLVKSIDNLLRNSNGGNPEIIKLRNQLNEVLKRLDK